MYFKDSCVPTHTHIIQTRQARQLFRSSFDPTNMRQALLPDRLKRERERVREREKREEDSDRKRSE